MVTRWQFYDAVLPETYTVPINPAEMGSLHGPRAFTVGTTTAIEGQALVTEGNAAPHSWSFSGSILDATHYAALLKWSEKPYRVRITDHFGRQFWVAMVRFDPTPNASRNYYWRHDYSMEALILTKPTAPTVGV